METRKDKMNIEEQQKDKTKVLYRVFFGLIVLTLVPFYITEKLYSQLAMNILLLPGLILCAKIAITGK